MLKVRRRDGLAGTVDRQPAGHADLTLLMRMISSTGASVGADHGSAVSPRYAAPYSFTGTLHDVVIQASPDRFGDLAEVAARVENSRQ